MRRGTDASLLPARPRMRRRPPARGAAAVLAAGALVLAACGADGSDEGSTATTAAVTTSAGPASTTAPVTTTPAGTAATGAPPTTAAGLPVRTERWEAGTLRLDERATTRLWGVVSAPTEGGPYPVVVLLHGSHPICRDDPNGYGSWPCPDGTEIPNHEGLAYLAEAIAAGGAVVVAPNVNVQYTFGAGEPAAAVRTAPIVEAALAQLEDGELGVPAGRLDLDRLVLAGHSVGGQDAAILAAGRAPGFSRPVAGTVLLAPAVNDAAVLPLVDVPTVVQLGSCDGDTGLVGGQLVTKAMAEPRTTPVALAVIERANHNFTNDGLEGDAFPVSLPGCGADELLAEEQQAAMSELVPGWIDAVLGETGTSWASQVLEDPANNAAEVPEGIQVALVEAEEPAAVLPGGRADALDVVELDGFTATWCPQGYYTPFAEPGTEPCHRPELTGFVGLPESVALSWDAAGATLTAPLPAGTDRLRLRAIPDLADVRLGDGPVVLEVSTPDGWSEQVSLEVPPSTRERLDPFDVVHALLLWHTEVLDLPAGAREVTVEVVSPAAGALQLITLGPA